MPAIYSQAPYPSLRIYIACINVNSSRVVCVTVSHNISKNSLRSTGIPIDNVEPSKSLEGEMVITPTWGVPGAEKALKGGTTSEWFCSGRRIFSINCDVCTTSPRPFRSTIRLGLSLLGYDSVTVYGSIFTPIKPCSSHCRLM